MPRLHLYISGRVQGVCFRAYTEREATRLKLTGWVKNLPDGRVEVVAEGAKAKLDELHQWCQHGPPAARVTQVETHWEPKTSEFREFFLQF